MAVRPDPHPVDVLAEVQVAVLVTEDRPLVLELRRRGDRRKRGHRPRPGVEVGQRLERRRHPDHRPDPRPPDPRARDDDVRRDLALVGDDRPDPAVVGADAGHRALPDDAGTALDGAAGHHLRGPDRLGQSVGRHEVAAQHDVPVEQRRDAHALVGVEQPRTLESPRLGVAVAPAQVGEARLRRGHLQAADLPEAPLPVERQPAVLRDRVLRELGHRLRRVGLEDETRRVRGRAARRVQRPLLEHRDVGPATGDELVGEGRAHDPRPDDHDLRRRSHGRRIRGASRHRNACGRAYSGSAR